MDTEPLKAKLKQFNMQEKIINQYQAFVLDFKQWLLNMQEMFQVLLMQQASNFFQWMMKVLKSNLKMQ